jgi:hypothetical protein
MKNSNFLKIFLWTIITFSVLLAGVYFDNSYSIEQNNKTTQSGIDGIRPPSNPCEDPTAICPEPPPEP